MALQKKPPVVTIMGHVDHGKTTLLDFIRKTNIAAKEVGEITQAIGAYQIEFKGQKVTFIDTPGHEAFTEMRRRGAMVADIVVLVIAANDGVMPQTRESIRIIKEAQVPLLVAINKVDLPGVSADKVKTQLAENEVFVEGYGGNVVAIPVSAKTGQGVDQLLEMILLTAAVDELKADVEGELQAVVIESKFDKNCGVMATLIVKSGQIKNGDSVWIGESCSKVKMMKDGSGKIVEKAFPGDPVLILGFGKLPVVGSIVSSCSAGSSEVVESSKSQIVHEDKSRLKIILRADAFGSLEAILGCLPEEVYVMEKAVGEITESDVLLAKTLGAEIYGFNLSPSLAVLKLAETEKVKVKTYRIIYDLLKDLEERVLKILEPTIDRKVLGKAEIIAIFDIKREKIAGCRAVEGKINKSSPVMIKRGEKVLGEARITSLKQGKQNINEVTAGAEFGAVLTTKLDFQKGDVVISYSLE